MISEKFSTNTESFNEFRRGRRIDLVTSGGMTHIQLTSRIFVTPYSDQQFFHSY